MKLPDGVEIIPMTGGLQLEWELPDGRFVEIEFMPTGLVDVLWGDANNSESFSCSLEKITPDSDQWKKIEAIIGVSRES